MTRCRSSVLQNLWIAEDYNDITGGQSEAGMWKYDQVGYSTSSRSAFLVALISVGNSPKNDSASLILQRRTDRTDERATRKAEALETEQLLDERRTSFRATEANRQIANYLLCRQSYGRPQKSILTVVICRRKINEGTPVTKTCYLGYTNDSITSGGVSALIFCNLLKNSSLDLKSTEGKWLLRLISFALSLSFGEQNQPGKASFNKGLRR